MLERKLFMLSMMKKKNKIVEKLNGHKYDIGRFKGLGEMPASDLKSTTMNKANRSLIRVKISDDPSANEKFHQLMGKEAHYRFRFIRERAAFYQELDV